ncbi:MAG TPA: MFS transporter [Vicinamibacterales bacterium]|nr:MFS transporter [Vicinamibacterales bacterium]
MGYRRNLFAVTSASFIGFMGFTLVMPFLPLYFHQLGVEDVGRVAMWSGLSLGVTPALTAVLAPLWGRLADRFGRKIMVERSLASFVVVMSAMAFVSRPWHVFALRMIQGLFAGYGALTLTMAADSAPPGRMGQAIGTVQTAQRLGPALGPVFGGSIAAIAGLRRAFMVAGAFYFLALVLVFLMYDERIARAHAEGGALASPGGESGTSARRAVTFRNVLAFENFLLMAVVIFGLQFVDRSFGPILPLYVGELGTTTARIPLVSGLLFSVAAGAGAIGHHYCARLLQRRTATQLIAAASAVAAAGALAYVAAHDVRWLFVATPLFGLAIGVGTTAAYTAAAAVIPANVRGVGFGLLTTASLVGLAVSPVVCGLLAATSIRAVFALDVVALGALAIAVHRLGGDGGRGNRTPADEPVPENL